MIPGVAALPPVSGRAVAGHHCARSGKAIPMRLFDWLRRGRQQETDQESVRLPLSDIPDRHTYARASEREATDYLRRLIEGHRIPDLPPFYLKPGEKHPLREIKVQNTPTVYGVKIDRNEMVLFAAIVPLIRDPQSTTSTFRGVQLTMPVGGENAEFLQNGIFVSTVDLKSSNCTVFLGSEEKEFLARGAYLWWIGRRGILLSNGMDPPRYLIAFERPLDALPTGAFIALFGLKPLEGNTDGFQIGPELTTITEPGSTGSISPAPIVRLKVK